MTSPATRAALDNHARHLGYDFEAWIDNFAEDAVLEFPFFASIGWPTATKGRDAIRQGLGAFLETMDNFHIQDVRVYDAADPTMVFAEYDVHATVKATGQRYDQHYVAILHARDGKIVRLREFPDMIVIAKTLLDQREPG
jgi:uncharacterized protein